MRGSAIITIDRTDPKSPELFTLRLESDTHTSEEYLTYQEVQILRNKCTKILMKNRKARLLK